jgi:hypothetical protein
MERTRGAIKEGGSNQDWAMLGSNQGAFPCQRTVRKPLTSDSADELHRREAVQAVQSL